MAISIKELWHPTVALALALMAVIVMMILPMPAWVLDIGLAASFALAILIFINTLFIERPLEFSAFPTVLLAALMLRLSLNVSSTKLIIGHGHEGTDAAGEVIEGFAHFIMGGSVFLGLVVFCVLMIVNFIVITKGAGRMAEVGARFALDGMPGKQLAIDSDMAAGAISHEEASRRRKLEQEETTFFGSLDGASKFVKGDAIAGLLITLLNLLVGLAMGVVGHNMPIGQAFETYAILTVGDGLVTQIPAVIISIAAALLLSKGGALGRADVALLGQLGGFPAALGTVAAILVLFALVPGLPFLPFLVGAIILGAISWVVWRNARTQTETSSEDITEADETPQAAIGDLIDIDEIHLQFAPDLIPMAMEESSDLGTRIASLRRHLASSFGVVIPEIRVTDEASLPPGAYSIRIQGVEASRATLEPGHVLILTGEDAPNISGTDVAEPVYGAPARWISQDQQEQATLQGYAVIAPLEVLTTHLLETIKDNFDRLFSRRAMRRLLDEFTGVSDPERAKANRQLLDEFIPDQISPDRLHQLLRLLLSERVSIRNLPLIIEAACETGPNDSIEHCVEHVRQRLGFQLVSELTEADGTLPLIQLQDSWEEIFTQYQQERADGATDIALPPSQFNKLGNAITAKLAEAGANGRYPAMVTSTLRRRFIHQVMQSRGLRNPVLSFEEIGHRAKPNLLGQA